MYDIAAGVSPAGLNALVGQLFANASAKKALFSGTTTQTVDGIGNVVLTYDVTAAPTFVLAPPTPQQWAAAQKKSPAQPLPSGNVFQLVFSNLAGSAAIDGAPPLAAHGAVTGIGIVTVINGVAALTLAGVLLDETSFSAWDKLIVNDVLVPLLIAKVDDLLKHLPLPQVPKLKSLTFQPITLAVNPQALVVGTSFSNGPPTDLSGFTVPPATLFILAKLTALDKLLATQIKGNYTEEDHKGPSAWTASGRVSVDNPAVTIAIGNGLVLKIGGSFSAYGELSGAGVGITKAVLCPIGAAADAISNPSKWDKVISSFALVYSPNPLPLPVSVTVAAPSGTPATQAVDIKVLSDSLPSSIKLIVKPTWSGSVTGSALAAAAAAFVDLVSVIFGKLIIKKIAAAYGHGSFSLPVSEMSQKVSLPQGGSITVSLTAPAGAALQPFGNDQLVQSLQIAIT